MRGYQMINLLSILESRYSELSGYNFTLCDSSSLTAVVVRRPHFLLLNTHRHWSVIYYPREGSCEYFNSLGADLDSEIALQCQPYITIQNRVQPKGSDTCGYYCIYYCLLRVMGGSMLDILTSMMCRKFT